jgi:hypothetical protein
MENKKIEIRDLIAILNSLSAYQDKKVITWLNSWKELIINRYDLDLVESNSNYNYAIKKASKRVQKVLKLFIKKT